MSKKIDLSKKSEQELVETVNEKRNAVRDYRFNMAGSAKRDVRAVRKDKKEVARSLTELNRRKREEKTK